MFSAVIEEIGKVHGRLTVIRRYGTAPNRHAVWLCDCACGKRDIPVCGSDLRRGNTCSCGCLRKETCAQVGRMLCHGKRKCASDSILRGLQGKTEASAPPTP